jgi:hypothetical protein
MKNNLIVMYSDLDNNIINTLINKDGIKSMYGLEITNRCKESWIIEFNDEAFDKDELIDELNIWTIVNSISTQVYFFG